MVWDSCVTQLMPSNANLANQAIAKLAAVIPMNLFQDGKWTFKSRLPALLQSMIVCVFARQSESAIALVTNQFHLCNDFSSLSANAAAILLVGQRCKKKNTPSKHTDCHFTVSHSKHEALHSRQETRGVK